MISMTMLLKIGFMELIYLNLNLIHCLSSYEHSHLPLLHNQQFMFTYIFWSL